MNHTLRRESPTLTIALVGRLPPGRVIIIWGRRLSGAPIFAAKRSSKRMIEFHGNDGLFMW
jgi:hypothetical protein